MATSRARTASLDTTVGPAVYKGEWVYDSVTKERINTLNMGPSDLKRYDGDDQVVWRPDLNEFSSYLFKQKYLLAERIGNRVKQFYSEELQRASITGTRFNPDYMFQLTKQFFTIGFGNSLSGSSQQPANWEDAVKMVNYVDRLSEKLSKYQLIPINEDFRDVKTIRQSEDDLADRFLREMQKAPVSAPANDDED